MHVPPADPLPSAEQPAAITRLIVRVIAEITGRGPTRVRTSNGEDIITVVMRDTFTKAERNLVAQGHGELVIAMRRALQQSLAPVVVPAVEAITGRRVYAFLSDHSITPDVSVKTFVLERIDSLATDSQAQKTPDSAASPDRMRPPDGRPPRPA